MNIAARRISTAALASLGRCSGFRIGPSGWMAPRRSFSDNPKSEKSEIVFTATDSGQLGTEEYRISFKDVGGKDISPWHDIPLENGNYYNFVCEIPRYTTAKLELAKHIKGNPIVQDKKDGKLRYYAGPMYWNYGFLPQTWENPYIKHELFNIRGDNDPLDVVEIGSNTIAAGTVSTVKVIGALAMIDDGELDWKLVAIDVKDKLALEVHDVTELDDHVISGIREWFRWYKTPFGKPLNKFEFNEMCMPRAVAHEVIEETHDHWLDLVQPEEGKEIRTEDRIWTGTSFTRGN